jgi:tetratricopeptide (TPR) repeat protein
MKHVTQIRKIVEQGHLDEAHKAIEDLLELGPKNLEALKLKAALFEHVGRFEDEENLWRRIIEIDNEDEDAIQYFQKAQLEDREHYYFTDPLPGGGRRFLAYPRTLVSVSFIGLVGCVSFLLLTRANGQMIVQSPMLLMGAFLLMVVSPWLAIVYLYVRTIRSINVTSAAIEVSTRFKTFRYAWPDIQQICLAHSGEPEEGELKLLILPREKNAPPMSIDFAEASSAVRARRHLIQEIRDHFQDIRYESMDSVSVEGRPIRRF